MGEILVRLPGRRTGRSRGRIKWLRRTLYANGTARGQVALSQEEPVEIDLSVIVPTFRRPKMLREALESVLIQEDVDLEVLVLDDSPEGSARQAVEDIRDARIRYRKQDTPSGGMPGRVRNDGWPQTDGPLVHFLDDDDRVVPGAYRALIAAIRRSPGCGVAFGRVRPFGGDDEQLAREEAFFAGAAARAERCRSRYGLVAHLLFMEAVLVNSACVIRRECLEQLRGYEPQCAPTEDIDLFVRAIRQFGYRFLNQDVLEYRVGLPSQAHSPDAQERADRSYRLMYDRYRSRYGRLEFRALQMYARTVLVR